MLEDKRSSRGLVLILGVELAFGRSDRCGNLVGDNKSRGGEVRGFENGGSLQDHWQCLTKAKCLHSFLFHSVVYEGMMTETESLTLCAINRFRNLCILVFKAEMFH